MIHEIARLYVNALEPALKIAGFVLLAVFVLYLLNLLRGGGAKGDVLSSLINGIVKMLLKTLQLLGRGLLGALRSTWRTLRLLLATIRDFLFSKDL